MAVLAGRGCADSQSGGGGAQCAVGRAVDAVGFQGGGDLMEIKNTMENLENIFAIQYHSFQIYIF